MRFSYFIGLMFVIMFLSQASLYASGYPFINDDGSVPQLVKVSGTITDATTKEPLVGVNVVLEGTTIGVLTDVKGSFTINVPNLNGTLAISYIGYVVQKVPVNGLTTINVALSPDLTSLDEVVVIGYGTSTRKVVSGAVVSLKADEITQGGATKSSVSSMLQGRAAGVEVSSNDGLPGQSLNIVIRGSTSITNSNEPLYVVDGYPMAAGVSISPDDIETIEILKDAASAAIYGSRASSGVVLITTKRGSAGKSEISLDTYYGVQSMIGEVKRLSWAEVGRITNEQYAMGVNDGNPWYNEADLALPNNTDWLKEATRQAPIQNYTLRASGGDDVSHFALSGNYFNQQGIFLNSNFERYSLRLNADRKFGKRTKVGMNFYSARVVSDGTDRRPGSRTDNPLYALLSAAPGRAAYNEDGSYAQTVLSRDTQEFRNPLGMLTERVSGFSRLENLWKFNCRFQYSG